MASFLGHYYLVVVPVFLNDHFLNVSIVIPTLLNNNLLIVSIVVLLDDNGVFVVAMPLMA